MPCGEIHQNNTTQFIVTISDCNGAINISAATVKQLIFQKPQGDKLTFDSSFYTDGTDGKILYTVGSGVLDTVGAWKLQSYIQAGPSGWYSDIGTFKVERNL